MSILKNWLKGFTPIETNEQSVRNKRFLPGFTLVEISIVVAILAVAGTAAVVSYSSLPSLKLEAETRKVLADIYWARQRAVATNIGHALRFDQAGKKYSIYKSPTGTSSDFTSANFLKEIILGISLSLAQTNLYVYSPKGNMYLDQTSIQFNNQGKTKNIRVFAETGNVKLE
ncbi:MAG: prepilin-type N-terminal cleavage/methylation domain-containing protein [Candidatus Omnitrophota bacterium]|nr:prepilin-type N-terminal cleavage/methylation domain-containing protein [Candidatus Omnitrophota bacterium]